MQITPEPRNYRIDLLRIFLIFFVIFGHLIEPLNDGALYKALYLTTYLFHMPLFVGISGFLTPETASGKKRLKALLPIVIPLAVFTGLYEMYEIGQSGHLSKYPLILVPYWILWYLYSLICWRLLFPLIRKVKHPIILTLAISLIAGFTPLIGYGFGLSRTLYFFPFFILGHHYRVTNRALLQKWPQNPLINAGIILTVASLMYLCRDMNEEWLYGSYHYGHFTKDLWKGPLIRMGIYALSFITALSITSLMQIFPNRKTVLSSLGMNTLYAYVWHGFLIKLMIDYNVISKIGEFSQFTGAAAMALISLATALIFTSSIVKIGTKKFLFTPAIKVFTPAAKWIASKTQLNIR